MAPSSKSLRTWLSDPSEPSGPSLKKPVNDPSTLSTAAPSDGADLMDALSEITSSTIELPPQEQELPPLEDDMCDVPTQLMKESIEEPAQTIVQLAHDADAPPTTPLTMASLHELEQRLAHLSSMATQKPDVRETLGQSEKNKFDNFTAAIASGNIEPRTYLGSQFRNAHKAGTPEGDAYKCMKRDEAAAHRLAWAKSTFANWKEVKTQSKTWRRIDTTKGVYKTLAQLILDQGSDELAMIGILKLIKKCVAMGYPWVQKHPQTELVMYLLLQFQFQEDFEQSWTSFKAESDSGVAEALTQIADPGVEAPIAAVPKGKAKAKAKAKASVSNSSVDKDEKSKFALTWANANKVKVLLSKVTSAAMEMSEQIGRSDDWLFARNAENKGLLDDKLKSLKDKLTGFHRTFMTEDGASVRRQFGEDYLTTNLETIINLKSDVLELQKFLDQLKKRKNI
jgi:hypothetical protein